VPLGGPKKWCRPRSIRRSKARRSVRYRWANHASPCARKIAAVIASASRLYSAITAVLGLEAVLVPHREVAVPHEVIAGKVEEGLGEEVEE